MTVRKILCQSIMPQGLDFVHQSQSYILVSCHSYRVINVILVYPKSHFSKLVLMSKRSKHMIFIVEYLRVFTKKKR